MKNLIGLSMALFIVACDDKVPTEHEVANDTPLAVSGYVMNEAALRNDVQVLASDAYGGRAPGTPGEELTVKYLANAFEEAGLSPVSGSSYFQDVPLVSITATNNPTITIDGGATELQLNYRNEQVVWTRQQSETSSVSASEMVFVGYGINAPERNWNDYEGIDVKGKTVVMLINDPGYATQDAGLFSGNTMTYYGRWDYKFDEASRQGAAGAIMVHETQAAAYGWATVDASWIGAQYDTVRADKGVSLAGFEAWVTNEAARQLFAEAGLDFEAQVKAAQIPGFKAIPMGSLKASASLENTVSTVTSRNVAAFLPGSEHPDEVFVYMAHWDHIGTDLSAAAGTDAIYNGALDNATGTAGLLELARAYASLAEKPKRSALFLAVTAEEQGLLGSAYYATNPLLPLKNTIGGLNMDGLNIIGRTRDVTVIGLGNSELDDYLNKAAVAQDRVLVADQEPEKGYFYRSDHFELSKLGVPMLYPNAGYDHREKGRSYGDQKAAEYVKSHYHGPSDEYDPNWDLSGAMEDLNLYFDTGLMIMNSTDWPEWREGTEFKAAREKQRGN